VTAELFRALELAQGLAATAANIERIALATSNEAAAWAFTQWELRKIAERKFSRAAEMLFTREALEQASHEVVAKYHASRFPEHVAVADLTAGIGSDLIQLSHRGEAIGYETDSERIELLSHNLVVNECVTELSNEDCMGAEWPFEYAFADPSRRVRGTRTLELDEFQPNPRELATRMTSLKLGGIKLSPIVSDDDLHALGQRIEFVSYDWECREALIWLGTEVEPGHAAVRAETAERLVSGATATTSLEMPLTYFYEADPAAIRAHCLPTLCELANASLIGDSNGYITSDEHHQSPWLKTYRVVDSGNYDPKRVRESLASNNLSCLDVKTRGAAPNLAHTKKHWRIPGGSQAWVTIYPVRNSLKHAILVTAND